MAVHVLAPRRSERVLDMCVANPASEAPSIVLTLTVKWPMLDGEVEPGGGPRRIRTVSVRLVAAGGVTARSISTSLARAGVAPEVAGS